MVLVVSRCCAGARKEWFPLPSLGSANSLRRGKPAQDSTFSLSHLLHTAFAEGAVMVWHDKGASECMYRLTFFLTRSVLEASTRVLIVSCAHHLIWSGELQQ